MRSLVILVALVVGAWAPFGHARAEDAKDCARISDDAKRLICYDLIFKVKQTVDQQGKWQVTEETSKIDDRKNVFVGLASNERVSGRFGPKEKARLLFACREGKTLAYSRLAVTSCQASAEP